MANDIKMRVKYVGQQSNGDKESLQVVVSIDRETFYELKYLLRFAAEKHDNYCHIEDAIHIKDSLEDCLMQANEMFDAMEEEDNL